MNKETSLKILSQMYVKKNDILNERYISYTYSFYDFFNDKEEMKEEYENILKELYKSGYVKIDLKSLSSFDCATIKITAKGVTYVEENK